MSQTPQVPRDCLLCQDKFVRSTRFEAICPRCTREQDNQTLEAVLALPGNLIQDTPGVSQHDLTCGHWSGYQCDCDAESLDPEALAFHEAVNN